MSQATKAKAEEAETTADENQEDEEEAEELSKGLEDILSEKALKSIEGKSDEIAEALASKLFDGVQGAIDRKDALEDDEEEGDGEEDIDEKEFEAFQKSIENGERGSFKAPLKAFEKLVQKDTSVSGNFNGDVSLSEMESDINNVNKRNPFLRELVNTGNISGSIDVWLEVTSETGAGPATVAELAAMDPKDYTYEEKSAKVKKVGVYNKHSREMLEDLPSIVSDIRNELLTDLELEIDSQILSGDGTGTNLIGILQNATAFDAGNHAGTMSNANNFDVLRVAVGQVRNKDFQPDVITLNPDDVTAMEISKGSDGHYVLPPFRDKDGNDISSCRIVENTGVAQGDFLVGDFSKSSVKFKRGVQVEMTNSDGDDFVKDRITVRATARLVQRVKGNDYEAFVEGTFSAAKTALNAA